MTTKEWNDEQLKRRMTAARQRAIQRFPNDLDAAIRYAVDDLTREEGNQEEPFVEWVLIEMSGGVNQYEDRSPGITIVAIDWDEINDHNEEYAKDLLERIVALPRHHRDRIRKDVFSEMPHLDALNEIDQDADSEVQNLPRIVARFVPQAWVNDHAVEIDVDESNETEWDASATFYSLPSAGRKKELLDQMEAEGEALDIDDYFFNERAPKWVQHHQGPFSIWLRFESSTAKDTA